ncbi:MAG: ribosome maturation factor RimP [Candidatus Omnitrophica bacterium]|nr:ribosome maturation factor RimP [Candidatus Omnitrophota bacterium]
MENEEVIARVAKLIEPYLKDNGIELIEMTYRREAGGMTLRLLVDTPSGIRIDECEALNNRLGELLDAEDVISEHYIIEVSSPGLDRPVKTGRDFERSMGKALVVTTFGPIEGSRSHSGTLIGMDKEKIVLESGGISTEIPRAKIAMARLKIEF